LTLADFLRRLEPVQRVSRRKLIENKGAEWPLTRKFGCEAHMAADLLVAARQLGLRPTADRPAGLAQRNRTYRLDLPCLRASRTYP